MPGQRENIERLLDEMDRETRESYARGWRDAIAALQARAPEMTPVEVAPKNEGNGARTDSREPQRPRGRPAKAINLVQGEIFGEPGLRGVDIVRSLEKKGTPVVDRTVRSALRRLKVSKIVWQRNGKWYPKPKAENEIGETLGTSPH
jgi:hypothetical protein